MAKINTTVDFDYVNGQYKVTALGTGSNWNSSASVVITDPKGFQAASIPVSPSDNPLLGYPRGSTTYTFNIPAAGYNFIDTDKNSLAYNDYATSLNIHNEPSLSAFSGTIKAIATGLTQYNTVSQIDDVYSGIPVLITRGDAVPHFYVESVSNKNVIRYNTTLLSSAYLTGAGCNLDDSIGVILSGAYSGTKFHVWSHSPSTTGITIDRDATNWSGAYFKLMPYRTITSYSGWENYSGQTNGVHASFGLNSARSVELGSLALVGSHLSSSTLDAGNVLGIGPAGINLPVTVAAVLSPTAAYQYDIALGDIIQYYKSGSLATAYGTILEATADSPAPGFTTIKYWPTGIMAPVPNGNANIYRSNVYELVNYPEFNKEYMVSVLSTEGVVDSYRIKTPSAELELTANEFDSTYGSIGDVAHFHIGPLHLSNGQVVQTNYLLRYVVDMYQGDVTSSTPITSWNAHATMGTDIGLSTNGSYFKKGIFTATYAQALNASETLIFDVSAGVGAAKKQKIVTIPVQPSA